MNKIVVGPAVARADVAAVRDLFLEYAASLEISLCFQNFEQELATLPGKYAAPEGRLFLAREGQEAAGCIALRPLDNGACEMKRLFIRPKWRGKGLGRLMATRLIEEAIGIGYSKMRLDTLDSMKPAIALYRSLGFLRIEPYYSNPSDRAVFMELALVKSSEGNLKTRNGSE